MPTATQPNPIDDLLGNTVEVGPSKSGRPVGSAKRPFASIARKHTGPQNIIEQLTLAQMRRYLKAILTGATPHDAAQSILRISYSRFAQFRQAGQDPKCTDPVKKIFWWLTERAQAGAVVDLERWLYANDKQFWAKHSPAMRSTPERPGWTDEAILRHTDADGTGPVRHVFDFRVMRFAQPVIEARKVNKGEA